jgi:uncharacterized protein YPO0396
MTDPVAAVLPGFRLHQVEVYNWGTFDRKAWPLHLGGENTLLTGDIGSGKSTLVDAITTLLVPAHRVAYNKAAGAEARERNLRSYVLGHYKSERGGDGPGARPVALRDGTTYSVILAVFRDPARAVTISLAQVFWCKAIDGAPERMYLVSDAALSIREDFIGFTDWADLRKRLRKRGDCDLHDTFPPYGAELCRRLGTSPQALELFHQTVSMKAVGNLTDFVRSHMLEAPPTDERVDALLNHFADLTRAHQAVLDARRQVDGLTPLLEQCRLHADRVQAHSDLTACRDALDAWFGEQKEDLYRKRIRLLGDEEKRQQGRVNDLIRRRGERDQELSQLISDIAINGGDRIAQLSRERTLREQESARRTDTARKAKDCCALLKWEAPADDASFLRMRESAVQRQGVNGNERARLHNDIVDAEVKLHGDRETRDERERELASLGQRASNLDSRLIALRRDICQAVGIAEEELPFAGEILQVRLEAVAWQGAIERVLRNLGQSLLVQDIHYAAVAAWVDEHHLRGKLVYYHTRIESGRGRPGPRSLANKVQVKPNSWAYAWLLRKLQHDHDYVCCESMEEFRREEKALTIQGQIKEKGGRHEKDDRRRLDDPTQFVLGWSNQEKVAAMRLAQQALEQRIASAMEAKGDLERQQRGLERQADALRDLLAIASFADLDVAATTSEIARLDAELERIRTTSDVLAGLTKRKQDCEDERALLQKDIDKAAQGLSDTRSKLADAEGGLVQASEARDGVAPESRALIFPRLEALRAEKPSPREFTIESSANVATDWRRWLQEKLDALAKQLTRLRDAIVVDMTDFRNAWPALTQEVDARVEAAAGYQAILDRLQRDDLPRFCETFRKALRENTIHEIANFHAQLQREQKDIEQRIADINRSLHGIDYNPNRYIALVGAGTGQQQVAEFRRDLRACIENTLGGGEDDAYSEAKYQQVAAIIERLRGRPGWTEEDRRWRDLVTDVRNWFEFSASECWRDGDVEHERYSDSGGKSGGQKEKLAYTVLAASLAYQYRMRDDDRQRRFCFVVIDEAFGRGSDESARFGLDLFSRLQLQLLIATPLQKIRVIEPFVANVGFVANRDGKESMIRNLTIAEYRAELASRKA